MKTLQPESSRSTGQIESQVSLPQNKQFYPALDGLRACAVLMVFAQHYVLSLLPNAWQWGWAGVDVFFVLSGFLITGILFDTRDSEHRLRNFYIRRTLRIFPLYYAVLLVLFCLTPLMHWGWNITWLLWPLYLMNFVRFVFFHRFVQTHGMLEDLGSPLTFLHRPIWLFPGHFWSLSVEEQFYLAWPLVVFKVLDRRRLINICAAVVIALPIVRLLCLLWIPADVLKMEFFYRFTPLRVDSLLLGGLLALVIRGPEKRIAEVIAPWLASICAFILVALPIVQSTVLRGQNQGGTTSPFMETLGFTVIDLLAACSILFCLHVGSPLFNLLTTSPLRKLGKVSYGFYVFHNIPHAFYISLAIWLGRNNPIAITLLDISIGFAATLALALLSYRFLETPFLRLKDRWAP